MTHLKAIQQTDYAVRTGQEAWAARGNPTDFRGLTLPHSQYSVFDLGGIAAYQGNVVHLYDMHAESPC